MARVSIGIPVYNGGDVIGESLACLRDQTFEDIEVAISDNASTDATSDICADFARADRRFRHVRGKETIPWAQNFAKARDLTSADLFLWRADDDLSDPDYIECLVRGFERRPDADLAVAPIFRIVSQAKRPEHLFELPTIDPTSRASRLRTLLLGCHPSWFYGMWRRAAVNRDWDLVVRDYPFLWASDHLAMLPAILDERVVLVPETRFIQRIVRPNQVYRLAPQDQLKARDAYERIALEMVAARSWDPAERPEIDRILQAHIDLRVATRWKMYRRMIGNALRGLVGLEGRR